MIKVDARGYSCPEPVIMAKNALAKASKVVILVDSETPKQNITRYATNNGYSVDVSEDGEGGYELCILK